MVKLLKNFNGNLLRLLLQSISKLPHYLDNNLFYYWSLVRPQRRTFLNKQFHNKLQLKLYISFYKWKFVKKWTIFHIGYI